jgi:hypothetical protein
MFVVSDLKRGYDRLIKRMRPIVESGAMNLWLYCAEFIMEITSLLEMSELLIVF